MKNQRFIIFAVVLIIATVAVSFKFFSNANSFEELPLEKIKLPEGFKIEVYARVPNARSMVLSDNGTLFVGNRSEDNV
jgi:hypothetical protein